MKDDKTTKKVDDKKTELPDEQLEQASGGWNLISYTHICNDCGAEFRGPKTNKFTCPVCKSTNTRLK